MYETWRRWLSHVRRRPIEASLKRVDGMELVLIKRGRGLRLLG